jgi:outer membrane receptor protein involved in Fe transport
MATSDPAATVWRAGWTTIGAACAIFAGPSTAAEVAQTAVEEVIVTGTRLPPASVVAGGPAISVDRVELERAGVGSLETYLNTLPQTVPTFGAAANNPSAAGAAFIDLRGLGASRNLVLIEGRRVTGANAAGAVDVNALPPGLVERVEITTGGASAVYGADAVAGVVNIILRRRFEGVELSGRTSITEQGDGRQHQLDLTLGRNLERGRLLAAAGWFVREAVGKGERAFSSQAAGPSSFFPTGAYVVAGPNQPSQAAVNAVFGAYGVAAGAVPRGGGFGGFGFNADGTLFSSGLPNSPIDVQNFRGSLGEQTSRFPDVYAYNFEPFNKLILPLERRTAALIGDVQLTDGVELYGQALYALYDTETSLAPTPAPTAPNPLFLAASLFLIPVTHPLIPADLATLLASRTGDTPPIPGVGAGEDMLYRLRTTALGARTTEARTETRHLVGGARAELSRGWTVDAYAAFGRYTRRDTQGGLLSVARMQQLLSSPTAGRDLCEGGFDPFGVKLGAACFDFVRAQATNRTRISQESFVVSAVGPAFELPTGPLALAVGAELREVRFRLTPDPTVRVGEVAGFNPVLPLSGRLRFRDVFVEAAAPLWRGSGAEPFAEAAIGARNSDDADGGTARSYKAEFSLRPSESLRLRGSYQRAVRAPNIDERFDPVVDSFATASDPCSDDSPQRTPQVLALCQAQAVALGLPASFATGFRQFGLDVGARVGGNPDLASEKADTFALGFVWRPRLASAWLRDVQLTVDGYDIDLRDAIGHGDVQAPINACYNLDGENPDYGAQHPACQLLTRSGLDFRLEGLDAREVNQARIATSGIDATAGLAFDLAGLADRPALGVLDARLVASWLGRFEEQTSAARPALRVDGTISDSSLAYRSLPRWKGRLDLVWRSGDIEVGLAGRYTSRMSHRILRLDPTAPATGVGAAAYFDLSLRWAAHKRADIRAGIVNLFDRGPELYVPAVDANTEPSTFDVLGRRFWISLMVRR